MGLGERAATALALVIHELATNSLKYGALSTDMGTLDVACDARGDEVVVVWTERGGPKVATPTGPNGYGSKLASRTMSGHLGGSIDYDWDEAGVIVTLRMMKARLAQ
jgi:two-component sensor histidine kinase